MSVSLFVFGAGRLDCLFFIGRLVQNLLPIVTRLSFEYGSYPSLVSRLVLDFGGQLQRGVS
jgi:hypothetical protein